MNRQQRRRAILDGHHRSALRAVAFYRAEARAGRAHGVDAALWPFITDAHATPLDAPATAAGWAPEALHNDTVPRSPNPFGTDYAR